MRTIGDGNSTVFSLVDAKTASEVADKLQLVVDEIRKGTCDAKSGVLTLSTKNDTITTTTLGTARTSEYMGMLAYSSARLYELIDA